jgi:Protein of unknown function (DUF1269)
VEQACRLARDLITEPDAIAATVRDKPPGARSEPAVRRAVLHPRLRPGLGALMGKITKSSIDQAFQDQVRDMLKPGTSALFLTVEKVSPDKAVEALTKYGGTVLKTSLSKEAEKELQKQLHGDSSDPAA